MDTALGLLKVLGNISSGLKVVAGGPVYWIAAVGFGIFALMLGVWIQKAKNKAAYEESKKTEQQEQTGGKTDNNTAEDNFEKAEDASKKEREKVSDASKKSRG